MVRSFFNMQSPYHMMGSYSFCFHPVFWVDFAYQAVERGY